MKISKLMTSALMLGMGMSLFAAGGKDKKSSGPVTIDLWYGAAVTEAGPPPADWKALSILKEKGIDLQLTALPSAANDQAQKLNAAGAANALPDIFMVERDTLVRLAQQGLLADVSDMFAMMPNRTKLMYDDAAKSVATVDGVCYGLASPGSIAKNEGVLIRKDWLDKLGLSVPKTTEDFKKVMHAFTYNDPDGNGKQDTWGYGCFIESNKLDYGLGPRLDPLLGAFGVAGAWNLTKANVGLNVFKPEYYDAVAYIKSLVDDGCIDPNWLAYKKDDFRAAWKQGKFGMMREQNAAFAAQNNYKPFDDNFPTGEWIIVDPPVGPNGKSAVGVYDAGYRIYAVSAAAAKAGKKEAIAQMLEWMSSEEGYFLLGWGEKDVNFVIGPDGAPTSKGVPDPAKAWDKTENVPLTQLRNMVFYNSDTELVSRYPTYKTAKSGKEMSALKALRQMQSKPWVQLAGANTMPAPGADVERFYSQGILEFLRGTRPLTKDSWNAWLAEFKKVGGQAWNDAGVKFATENNFLK
ncbi:MAG: extracellular solute-binding protein [Treponema sp.]|nr:extracellular solute-binding protein [Treponema sp.]